MGKARATGWIWGIGGFLLLLAVARAEEPSATPSPESVLRAHVDALCAPGLKGRRTRPAREQAAAYIAAAFQRSGLKPLPGQQNYYLDHEGEGPQEGEAPAADAEWLRNVAGYLPARTAPEGGIGEYVIVSAHYDHLGETIQLVQSGEEVKVTLTQRFDGADDNASGVAALLELARRFGAAERGPRALVFVAFDLEEQTVLGSKAWVRSAPLPLEDCAAFLTMDMLGRSVADLVDGSLFVMGTEYSEELCRWVAGAEAPAGGRLLALGIDFQPGYSDYLPFQHKKVPFVFVTSGACQDYHTPADVADRLNYTHLSARTDWLQGLVSALGAMDPRPAWREEPPITVAEIESLRGAIQAVQQRLPEVKGLPPVAGIMVKNFVAYLDKVLEDGEVTAPERSSARNTTLQLFQMAASLGRAR